MARGNIKIGNTLKLNGMIMPGHPHVKITEDSSCMANLPSGAHAKVLATQGSTVLLGVNPYPNSQNNHSTKIWMEMHEVQIMMD